MAFRASHDGTAATSDCLRPPPPSRRLSLSVDGPVGRERGKKGEGRGSVAHSQPPASPPTAALVLGNFQGVVVLDMGVVQVGDMKGATLRIEAPESARRPVTTVTVDHKPSASCAGVEVHIEGELALERGESHEAQVTWCPASPGRFRGTVAFRVDGRFPAQISIVGEAVDTGTDGKRRKGDAREGRKRVKGMARTGASSVVGRRRSLSQEAAEGSGPYTSMYGKENRLSLSCAGLPSASSSMLGDSASALAQGTTNKRQQMLKYSASRRLSLKLPPKRGKANSSSTGGGGKGGGGVTDEGSKAGLMRKALSDKGWAEKQAAGFANWLNFTLVGADQARHGNKGGDDDSVERDGDGAFAIKAAGVSSSPLKAMVAMRHEARQRMRSMALFRSLEIARATEAVADRAYDGTISLRRDRVMHADVGLSGALIDLVLCYEPRWLLLGLETVFGEIVPMPGASLGAAAKGSKADRVLRTFVAERLVKCPEIKARYGFRGRMASGRSEREYNDELSRHALTHFLNLVLFLDRAKAENLLHPCPCLFRKTAEVKCSVGMIKVFCQFLHGEGDFVRHLKKMGYVVSHVQSYVDEFDFHVANLAVDLRDGVRLTRLVEVVTGDWGLTTGLRVPAVSRLQKIFNTGKALERLERDGTVVVGTAPGAMSSKDIVDGDRHATLRLLWSVIARYSLSALLDRDALSREAEGVISAARKWRHAGFSPARPERAMKKVHATVTVGSAGATGTPSPLPVAVPASPDSPVSPPAGGRAVAGPEHPALEMPDVDAMRDAWSTAGEEGDGQRTRSNSSSSSSNGSGGGGSVYGGVTTDNKELLAALLVWCQAVCHGYGVPVRNFTTSFADGRALCLLLHYYHPRMLSLNAIRRTTAHLPRIGGGGRELEDWSASLDASKVTEAECRAALDGERANVSLVRQCVGELGGIPSMLTPFDSTNSPEEKVRDCVTVASISPHEERLPRIKLPQVMSAYLQTIITVVAHLCARLLESSAEIRATILLQRSYRSFLERTGRGDLVERARAAKARARVRAAAARAAALQAMSLERGEGGIPVTPPRRGITPQEGGGVMSFVSPEQRMYVSDKQEAYLAAVTIQRCWVAGRPRRLRRLGVTVAATTVQAVWRGFAARRSAALERAERVSRERDLRTYEAVAKIQAAVRGRSERRAFVQSKKAAGIVQVWVRGRLQRRWYLALKGQISAIVRIQALARGRAGRRLAAAARDEERVQALKQCERAATRDRQARAAAVAIQSVWRTRTAKSSFARDMDRIIRLQALSRGMASRALARERQHSAVSLQAAWRGMRARSSHLRAVTGILVLQALVRGVQMRVRLRRERREADERAKAALRAAERAEAAAGILQTWLRRCAAMKRRRLEEQKAAADARAAAALAAAVKMQAVVRGTLARRTLGAAVRAATVLQALVRGRQARDNIIRRSAAAVKIQSTARAASACALVRMIVEDRRQKRVAVVTIQALWRGMIVRATLSDRMSAAAVVQRWWRSCAEKTRSDALRAAEEAREAALLLSTVIYLQACFRGCLARRACNRRAAAAVTIQSRWRGVCQRTLARKHIAAAVRVQAFVRGAFATARYYKARSAAVTIQSRWRGISQRAVAAERTAAAVRVQAFVRGASAAARYRKSRSAALVIQARWRGVLQRVHAAERTAAAARIQAFVRGASAAARYRKSRSAALVIQARWRGILCRMCAAERKAAAARVQAFVLSALAATRYRTSHSAVMIIQARWRGTLQRAVAKERIAGVVRIQAFVRGSFAAARYRKSRAVALIIQTRWRGISQRAVAKERAAAAGRIQAFARATLADVRYRKSCLAAVVIQTRWRGVSRRALAAERTAAAIRIQSVLRGACAAAQYYKSRSAAVIIQTRWRGVSERLVAAERTAAAVRIQAFVRSAFATAGYHESRSAAVIIQTRWRGVSQRIVAVERTAAVLRVQAFVRGAFATRQYHKSRSAAVTIQTRWRGISQRALAAERTAAAIRVQTFVRGALATRQYHKSRSAAVTIQTRWRGMSQRAVAAERTAAAIRMQTFVRGASAAAQYRKSRSAAVLIQARWRCVSERAVAAERTEAAIRMQTFVRGASAAAQYRKSRSAAVLIQARWRGISYRAIAAKRRAAAVCAQAFVRGAIAAARYRACRSAVVVLQARQRGTATRSQLAINGKAAVCVQAFVRGMCAVIVYRRSRAAAVRLQAWQRGMLTRSQLANQAAAAVRVQTFVRGASAAARYQESRLAVVRLQAWQRGTAIRLRVAANAEAAEIWAVREGNAAMVLQAVVRGRIARARFRGVVAAAVVAQRVWRRAREARRRTELARAVLTASVVSVQAWWRMMLAMTTCSRVRRATIALQAAARGRAVRRAASVERLASTTIAAWWRSTRESRRYRRARISAVTIQSVVRGGRGRVEAAALWMALGRRFSKDKAATIIQAAARGMLARRLAGPRLMSVRARIDQANARARADPSQILGQKVNDALDALEHGTHLTSIIRACIALELTSRYSKVCCQVMAESRCPRVLYDLVRGLNRSPPHQKILKYTITTFRNIVQRGEHLPALIAAPPVAAETFVDLLQMYRERQEVFLPTVRLLQQLVIAHKLTKIECNEPKHLQRLESIRDILARKAATEAKGTTGKPLGIGAGRATRCLKAVQVLLDELARN